MKKLILCLIVGLVVASSLRLYSGQIAGAEDKKEDKRENMLILEVNSDGKIYTAGNHISEEKLTHLNVVNVEDNL